MQCACIILVFPALQYFSTLYHKRHDFRKTLLKIKFVFRDSLKLLSETFFVLRRIVRDMIKNVYWSSCKVPFYSCPFSKKMEFTGLNFEKYSNIKFHENPSSERRIVPCGRLDGQTDMTRLIVAIQCIKLCVYSHKHAVKTQQINKILSLYHKNTM